MRFHVFKNPSTITSSVVGAAFNPTLDATKGLESADDAGGPWLLHRTGSVDPPGGPRRGGVASPYDVVQRRWNDPLTTPAPTPVHFEFAIKTDPIPYGPPPTFPNEFQYWIGLFSASPDGIDSPPQSLQMVAFRFRPAVSDKWWVYGSNGSGVTPLLPPGAITVQTDTEYLLEIKMLGATAEFRINGSFYATLDTATDRLPDPSKLLGYGVRVFVFSTTGEDRTIRWKRISWDHV